MGPTILFTHLKIILLQYFQFSATINSIQTDPSSMQFFVNSVQSQQKNKPIWHFLILLSLDWDRTPMQLPAPHSQIYLLSGEKETNIFTLHQCNSLSSAWVHITWFTYLLILCCVFAIFSILLCVRLSFFIRMWP